MVVRLRGVLLFVVFLGCFFAFSYWLGRSRALSSSGVVGRDTVYLEGDSVRLSLGGGVLLYDRVVAPSFAVDLGFVLRDTVRVCDTVSIVERVDSLGIVSDWMLERGYRLDYSSDSLGVFVVDLVVRGNRLVSDSAVVRPRVMYVSEERVVERRGVRPWVMVGWDGGSFVRGSFGFDLGPRLRAGVSGYSVDGVSRWSFDLGYCF